MYKRWWGNTDGWYWWNTGHWVLGSLALGLGLGCGGLKRHGLGMTGLNLATYHHMHGYKQGLWDAQDMLERCGDHKMVSYKWLCYDYIHKHD
jgi:hypothetical protein